MATVVEVSANLPKRLPGRKYDRQFFFGITILLLATVGFIGPTAPWHAFAHWVQSWGI